MKQKTDSKVSGDGRTNDKKFHTFKETDILSLFNSLLIHVKEILVVNENNLSAFESEESDNNLTEKLPNGYLLNEKIKSEMISEMIYPVVNSIDEFDDESIIKRDKNLIQVNKMNVLNNLLSDPKQHSSFKTIKNLNGNVGKKEVSRCNII